LDPILFYTYDFIGSTSNLVYFYTANFKGDFFYDSLRLPDITAFPPFYF